jgi:hypothetical protein
MDWAIQQIGVNITPFRATCMVESGYTAWATVGEVNV